MRLLTLAALLIAAMTLPVQATTQPVKGAVHGTATAARSTGRGLLCIVTLGNRC